MTANDPQSIISQIVSLQTSSNNTSQRSLLKTVYICCGDSSVSSFDGDLKSILQLGGGDPQQQIPPSPSTALIVVTTTPSLTENCRSNIFHCFIEGGESGGGGGRGAGGSSVEFGSRLFMLLRTIVFMLTLALKNSHKDNDETALHLISPNTPPAAPLREAIVKHLIPEMFIFHPFRRIIHESTHSLYDLMFRFHHRKASIASSTSLSSSTAIVSSTSTTISSTITSKNKDRLKRTSRETDHDEECPMNTAAVPAIVRLDLAGPGKRQKQNSAFSCAPPPLTSSSTSSFAAVVAGRSRQDQHVVVAAPDPGTHIFVVPPPLTATTTAINSTTLLPPSIPPAGFFNDQYRPTAPRFPTPRTLPPPQPLTTPIRPPPPPSQSILDSIASTSSNMSIDTNPPSPPPPPRLSSNLLAHTTNWIDKLADLLTLHFPLEPQPERVYFKETDVSAFLPFPHNVKQLGVIVNNNHTNTNHNLHLLNRCRMTVLGLSFESSKVFKRQIDAANDVSRLAYLYIESAALVEKEAKERQERQEMLDVAAKKGLKEEEEDNDEEMEESKNIVMGTVMSDDLTMANSTTTVGITEPLVDGPSLKRKIGEQSSRCTQERTINVSADSTTSAASASTTAVQRLSAWLKQKGWKQKSSTQNLLGQGVVHELTLSTSFKADGKVMQKFVSPICVNGVIAKETVAKIACDHLGILENASQNGFTAAACNSNNGSSSSCIAASHPPATTATAAHESGTLTAPTVVPPLPPLQKLKSIIGYAPKFNSIKAEGWSKKEKLWHCVTYVDGQEFRTGKALSTAGDAKRECALMVLHYIHGLKRQSSDGSVMINGRKINLL